MGKVVLAALIALLLGATPAGAATYTVNRTDDPMPGSECGFKEPCSFREAVLAANNRVGGDVIVVRPGTYSLEPDLSAGVFDDFYGDLDIKGNTRIFASGRLSTQISGCASERAIEIHRGAVEIRDLRITGCVSAGDGGAIATRADGRGLLRLIDVRLDHNSAALSGGSLFAGPAFTVTAVRSFLDNSSASGGPGGGISALGRLTVVGSTFRANTSSDRGGNVAASGPFLSVRNSTLSAGSARSGGGNLFVGGVVGNRSVEASTLERGRVSDRGSGGAVQITEGNLRIVDSTLAKNKALPRGGGVSALLNARVTVFDSTVAGNRARFGAGIHGGQGGTVRVRDTLLAQNRSTTGAASDCSGDVRSLGHNVFARRCSFNRRSDIRTARPRVGRFALHGAATKTFEILRYSPAVDAGSARCTPRDQRNRLRRRRCDIGAFEFLGAAPRRRR